MSLSTDHGQLENAPIKWTVLAHILRPQGRKGEVLAELLTDFPERFQSYARVFLAPQGFAGSRENAQAAEVLYSWLPTGRNAGRVVLHFSGVGSISQAELLVGLDVLIPTAERPELESDTTYISDLIGCAVFDFNLKDASGGPPCIGSVTDVQFATTPDGARRLEEAAPLLAIETPQGQEVLVPFVKAFLLRLDVASKRIEMSLPPGLLDVNGPGGH